MSNTKVSEQEFHLIKKSFSNGATSKEVQSEFKRGETIIRRIKKARSWPAYQAGNKARLERRREQGLLDSNLTKKQSQGFLDLQTENNTLKNDNRLLQKTNEHKTDKIKRLEDELDVYRKREIADVTKRAKQSRSILRFLRRAS